MCPLLYYVSIQQALSCLSSLAPMCVEDYMTCQGNTRLLMLIEWCTKEEGMHAQAERNPMGLAHI